MKEPSFALIGAGSSSFAAALIGPLLRDPDLSSASVALVDTDPERLDLVERVARRLIEQEDADIALTASTDRTDVLDGADYVIVAISVGGDDAWEADLTVPAAHGVIQPVGDTVGIGGMSRAFRHVPELVAIARDMERLCPDATLFNHTNPMTVNCRAVGRETSIQCVGLCVGCELLREDLCRIAGAEPEASWLWAAGINHFTFAYRFLVDGRDAYPLVAARLRQAEGWATPELPALIRQFDSVGAEPAVPCQDVNPFCAELFESTGYYPGPSDRHVAEFLPHFFRSAEDYRTYRLRPFDIGAKKRRSEAFLAKFGEAAEADEPVDVDALVGATPSEEAQVLDIVRAIRRGTREVFFVNLPNGGQIANLPEDAVVEGPAVATADGLKPLVVGKLPEPILGWTHRWLEWGELVVDAALTGSKPKAMHCLAADPGCTGLSKSQAILDELIAANGRWMPQFGPR